MANRRLVSLVLALAALAGLLVLAPTAGAGALEVAPPTACPQHAANAAPGVQVREMTCLVNWLRAQKGLRPLALNGKLDRAGALKLSDNVRCREFSHTACGHAFTQVFRSAGYPGRTLGENLAWGSGPSGTPREIFRAWLGSAGHRQNMLAPEWKEMGLAVRREHAFLGVGGVALWANLFGAR